MEWSALLCLRRRKGAPTRVVLAFADAHGNNVTGWSDRISIDSPAKTHRRDAGCAEVPFHTHRKHAPRAIRRTQTKKPVAQGQIRT